LAGGEVMAAGAAVVRRHFWTLGPLAALGSLVAGLIQWGVLAAGNSVERYDKWAGHLLDGIWYVQGVRHRWGLDAAAPEREQRIRRYEADVAGVRNALGGAA
jgi:hypothetical protein